VDARQRTSSPVLTRQALEEQLSHLLGQKARLPLNHLPFTLTPDSTRLLFTHEGRPFALGLRDAQVTALAPTDPGALALSGGQASPDGRSVALQRGHGFAVVDGAGRTLLERTGETDFA